MRELGLQVKKRGVKRRSTNSRHAFPSYSNLLEHLEIVRPEQVMYLCIASGIRIGSELARSSS